MSAHIHPRPLPSKTALATLALALPLGLAAGLAARALLVANFGGFEDAPRTLAAEPELVRITPHPVVYRPAGSFTFNNTVVDAPLTTLPVKRPFFIMKHEVSAADYGRCVADGGCKATRPSPAGDLPAVNVSFDDAAAYAAWLSRKTGKSYRLPTDEEWIAAAGSAAPVAAATDSSPDNPATRWLAQYDAEAAANRRDNQPKPLGSAGTNELGVADIARNVWEWTSTCFVRATLSADGASFTATASNCTVRIAQGPHRAYVPTFIRDARAGGCAMGIPPSNLGFRLVREAPPVSRWLSLGLS